jgi:hypothetical protein
MFLLEQKREGGRRRAHLQLLLPLRRVHQRPASPAVRKARSTNLVPARKGCGVLSPFVG